MINKLIFILQCIAWALLSIPVWVVGAYVVLFSGLCYWLADTLDSIEGPFDFTLDWISNNIITRNWKS